MQKQKQRIAIADACGWLVNEDGISGISPINREQGLTNPEICSWILPDYLNDLNAMHEAEKILDYNQLRDMEDSVSFRFAVLPFHATAAQRTEAFLRTVGKWEVES